MDELMQRDEDALVQQRLDARIAQRWKDTLGAKSDVSLAHALRQTIEMNRDSCVEKRDGQRAARGWQHCW